ncbi:MAG: hypothetical protein IPP71_09465 [Bacteroidetes bacterium]|nr:hypothetical protein [Bacteroidota bacterium]
MKKENFAENEWNDLARSLHAKIKMQSNDLLPMKVIVVPPQLFEGTSGSN